MDYRDLEIVRCHKLIQFFPVSQMVECAKYFLSRVETVMDPDYEPIDNDIVQARVKTEGIIEHEFEISSKRGEMKKKLILVTDVIYGRPFTDLSSSVLLSPF